MEVRLSRGNKIKTVKLGFSWTALFFGVLVPLFRGDWKWFLIILLGEIVLGAVSAGFLTAFAMLIFPFVYNKIYAKDLYEKGFEGITPGEHEEIIAYIS